MIKIDYFRLFSHYIDTRACLGAWVWYNIRMNNKTLTSKQSSFIDALVASHGSDQTDSTGGIWYSRQQLLETANSLGMKYPPAWIVQDQSRKTAERGTFYVPEAEGLVGLTAMSPQDMIEEAIDPAFHPATPAPRETAAVDMNSYALSMVSSSMVPTVMKDYVAWGHHKDIEKIIRSGINSNVYVTGLSGNGKTTMIEQVCAKLKREMFRVNITAQTDEDDLLGGFRLVNGETKFVYGPVVEAMQRGAVLLLDEVDLGLAPIMCLQPVLEGKGVFLKKTGEWITPAAGFVVLATANTKGEGSDDGMFMHTNIQNEAFLDRFAFTYDQAYASKAIEKKILIKKASKYGADDAGFIDNLVSWAEVTRKAFTEGAIEKVISTRRLEDAIKAFAMFGDRMKAVELVTARFDESTREAFTNLYTKVDADIEIEEDEPEFSLDRDSLRDAMDAGMDIRFDVAYSDKDSFRAKYPRAKWDSDMKIWYMEPADLIDISVNTPESFRDLDRHNPRIVSRRSKYNG